MSAVLRVRRASTVTTVLAAGLFSALVVLPATAPAQAAPQAAGPADNGVPSSATVGGVTIENSFVSSKGWVHPDAGTEDEDGKYPARILLTNHNASATPASVAVAAPEGTTFLSASGPGTHPVSAEAITWTVTVPATSTVALVLEQQADTLQETPTLVWRDVSTTAVLTVGGSASSDAIAHGPKVIPPGATYETARYGDRPFPVVPVAYNDRAYQPHDKDLNTVINSPDFSGSTFNLYQEMSLGQLYPDGTVPSDGIATKDFTYAAGFDFTKREVPGNTCVGTTFADTPTQEEGTPLYPNRIKDGVYQLPGTTGFYGSDANGSAIIGSLAGVGALQQIDAGCGSPGKLVRDAAAIADPEIDYSDYDTDKDGVVDFFMAVFAGCGGNGASQLGACADGTSNVAPYDNVWPHSSSLEYYYSDPDTGLPGFTTDDQLKDLEGRPLWYTDTTRTDMTTTDKGDALKVFVRVGPYNVNPETAIDKASVISHEYGHSLGLPDFYSTGSRETYGDWNLMATDKSQNMDVFSRQELGWIVPNVLEPGTSPSVNGWTDSKQDTDEISWQTPQGTPYTLTEGTDGRVQNSEAYVAKLPGRQLLDPAKFDSGDKASKTHAWWSQSGQRLRLRPRGRAQPGREHPRAGRPPRRHHREADDEVALGHRVGLRLRLRADHDRRWRDLHLARVGERLHDVEHRPAGRQPECERLPAGARQRPHRDQRFVRRGHRGHRPQARQHPRLGVPRRLVRHQRPRGCRQRRAAVQLLDRPGRRASRLVHRRPEGDRDPAWRCPGAAGHRPGDLRRTGRRADLQRRLP